MEEAFVMEYCKSFKVLLRRSGTSKELDREIMKMVSAAVSEGE